ncbi:MAG: permease [Bacteroidales bacterium]|nr:permease [Bacteroidales bacterium]
MENFWISFLAIVNSMGPYLLLGFLIAGILHVFVPKKFYNKYLSQKNKLSVIYAALLGLPLPLCSCGVIPTAIGLKNEGASKGAVASFMIATPQTGIDSILATFSLMGLGFAIVRPVAALITGICGGLLVNQLVKVSNNETIVAETCVIEHGNRLWRVLKYAFFDMMQDIGPRLLIGLLLAAIINVAIPDEFFLTFGNYPLLQMLIILAIAVPMYICSTGSIPVAAALMMKGLSPGAALVMLIAGPAVNFASILVVRKAMGRHFTWIYLLVIVGFSILFGLITNAIGIGTAIASSNIVPDCCNTSSLHFGVFRIICSVILLLLIIIALSMKFFSRFKKQNVAVGTMVYTVEGMHCNHCKAAVEKAVSGLKGVITAEANIGKQTLTITGSASIDEIRKAVEKAGFVFKG